jgi:hypothetical protein
MDFYLVAWALQQDNTQICKSHAHQIQILHKNNTAKKEISSQSYTKSEGHITASEYIVGKEKK